MPDLIPGRSKIEDRQRQFVVGIGDHQNSRSLHSFHRSVRDEKQLRAGRCPNIGVMQDLALRYSDIPLVSQARRLLPSTRILTSNRVIQ